jgi:hypothetical protein
MSPTTTTKKEKEVIKPIMAYVPPHPNQSDLDFAMYGVAYVIGAQVVIWSGRWATMSGTVIAVGPEMLHIQTIAGGGVRVRKNACCLIVDGESTNEEYMAEDSQGRKSTDGMPAISDGSTDAA